MNGFPLNPASPLSPKTSSSREPDYGGAEHHALVDFELPPEVAEKMGLGLQQPAPPHAAKSTLIELPSQGKTKVQAIVPVANALEAELHASPPVGVAAGRGQARGALAPWTECSIVLPNKDEPAQAEEPSEEEAGSDEMDSSVRDDEEASYKASYTFLSPPDKPGILGRIGAYRVSEMIGEGGMGYVFLAEDKYLRRPVALKVMKPEVAKRKRCWGWFLDEARAAASLQSDRVATIYQIGEQRGTLFLAMELLHGESLESRLKRGPVPLSMGLWIAREAALGLALVHRAGVFHRDIKPGNLWLGVPRNPDRKSADVLRTYGGIKEWCVFADEDYNQIKILDFGVARLMEGATGRVKRGEAMGTPPYMSPEQAKGEQGDARSDLFSLGVVLYRLLSGQLPFKGSTLMELITALAEPAKPVTNYNPYLSAALADLTMRMIELDPANRPSGAAEVADIINAVEQNLLASRPGQSKNSIWRRLFGGPSASSLGR
jgi:serine/threonine protein kinase